LIYYWLLLVLLSTGEGRNFASKVKSIRVDGCEGLARCLLRKGHDTGITIELGEFWSI